MLSFSDHGQMMATMSAASSGAVSDAVVSQVCTACPSAPRPQVDGLLPSPGSFRNDPVRPSAGTG